MNPEADSTHTLGLHISLWPSELKYIWILKNISLAWYIRAGTLELNALVQVLAKWLLSCVTFGNLLDLSVLQFSHLQNEEKNT